MLSVLLNPLRRRQLVGSLKVFNYIFHDYDFKLDLYFFWTNTEKNVKFVQKKNFPLKISELCHVPMPMNDGTGEEEEEAQGGKKKGR